MPSTPVDYYHDIVATGMIGRSIPIESKMYVKRGMYQQYVVMDVFLQGVYCYQVTSSSVDGKMLLMQRQKMMMMK